MKTNFKCDNCRKGYEGVPVSEAGNSFCCDDCKIEYSERVMDLGIDKHNYKPVTFTEVQKRLK
jgi:hypothetical protein